MTPRYWVVTVILEHQVILDADTAPEAEQIVRENIRDYLDPADSIIDVDAARLDADQLLEDLR